MYFTGGAGSTCPLMTACDFPPCRPFPLLSLAPFRTHAGVLDDLFQSVLLAESAKLLRN